MLRWGWLATYFVIVCIWNVLFLQLFWDLPIVAVAPLVLVTTIVLCFSMVASGNKWLTLVAGFFLYIVLILAQVIVVMLLAILSLDPYSNALFSIVYSVSVSITLVLLVSLIAKIVSTKKEYALTLARAKQTIPALVAIVANGVISIYIFTLVQREQIDFVTGTLLIALILIAAVAASIIYFIMLSKWIRIEQESTTYRQQVRFYDAYLQEKEANYLYEKTLKHDQKQHLIYLLNALEEEKAQEGISYLQRMLEDISAGEIIKSNNLVVDALLNYTNEQMRRNQIELVASVEVPQYVSIADVDFCIVLGNLLTNAIEATQQVKDARRVISLTIRYKAGNNLYIRVENPYENILEPKGIGRFASTKKSDQERGFGIYSAQQAIERYNGALHIETGEGKFVAEALLYGSDVMK